MWKLSEIRNSPRDFSSFHISWKNTKEGINWDAADAQTNAKAEAIS